jgi:hypothetical protein
MGFLRRLFGGAAQPEAPGSDGSTAAATDPATLDEEERARELELARFDQERVSELVRRQQMYAERSWTPSPQGGDRRADDEDATSA